MARFLRLGQAKGIKRMNLHVRYACGFLIGVMWVSFLVAPASASGAELKEETLKAWDAYIQKANSEMEDRLHSPFLWVDEVPDRVQLVRAGTILVSPVGQHNPKPVPSGLIHDWIGAAFIPNAKLTDVLSTVGDYDHYKEFYKPTVVDSKSLGSQQSCDKYSMLLANKEVVSSTALDAECEVCYHQVGEGRWYSVAYTTRLQEIRHYGRPDARELPAGQGSGYLWRIYSFARFDERDGGVYIELEAIALSREIPFAVRWVVDPIVRRVSKNSMVISLRQTEEAVRSKAGTTNGMARRSIGGDATSQLEPTLPHSELYRVFLLDSDDGPE
jgi:hypothetical protein